MKKARRVFRKRYAASLAVLVGMMAIMLASCGGGVSEDQVRRDIATSSIASKGFLSSSFADDSAYELVEFSIGQQQQIDERTRTVEYTGKIANESFESSFSGSATYAKQGDSWSMVSKPSAAPSSSKPMKGVSSLGSPPSLSQGESIAEFASSLDESGDGYTSVATQKSLVEKWFATDIIETECSFFFDSSSGWKQSGKPTVKSSQVEYGLEGRTFSCTSYPGIFNNENKVTYTITFGSVSDDGSVEASYTIDYDPAGATGTYSGTLQSVHETGSLSGKLDYSVGDLKFEVLLFDSDKEVSFSCRSTTAALSAGSGSTNAMSVEVATNILYGSKDNAFLGAGGMSLTDTFTEVL